MNDKERELWVLNDEGLYLWWKSSRGGLKAWVREHREELTRIIDLILNGEPQ